VYVVGRGERGVDYRVYDRASGTERAKDEARWKLLPGAYRPHGEGPGALWLLEVVLVRLPSPQVVGHGGRA
jgi:hypothetical protein